MRGRVAVRFGLVVAFFALGMLAFHIVMAPFYLYQIIPFAPSLALLGALAWPLWWRAPWRWLLGGLALVIGLVPGLAMALMGFKIAGTVQVPGTEGISPTSLYVLRHPLPRAREFYRWRYGEDAAMWEYLNTRLQGQKLLTHENRHLAIHPTIQLIHLDDWEMQRLWSVTDPGERVRRLVDEFGIKYYLFVPNERAADTNERMGAREWELMGLAKRVFEAGENVLYRLIPPGRAIETPAPIQPEPTLPEDIPPMPLPGGPTTPTATLVEPPAEAAK
jgi:hypothetical protein